jgi:AcrR family transcriptional regulator
MRAGLKVTRAMVDPITPEHGPKGSATKARILAAAKTCFSEMGYANTGIRDVAAAAGVSYALLGRYYGSKAGLLEAALSATLTADSILSVDRARFGENLANTLAKAASSGETTTSMTVLAAADPDARAIATRLFETQLIQPLTEWLGPPAARERAVAIAMLCAGYVTHARLVPLLGAPPTAAPARAMFGWLARSLQQLVDEPGSWAEYGDEIDGKAKP